MSRDCDRACSRDTIRFEERLNSSDNTAENGKGTISQRSSNSVSASFHKKASVAENKRAHPHG